MNSLLSGCRNEETIRIIAPILNLWVSNNILFLWWNVACIQYFPSDSLTRSSGWEALTSMIWSRRPWNCKVSSIIFQSVPISPLHSVSSSLKNTTKSDGDSLSSSPRGDRIGDRTGGTELVDDVTRGEAGTERLVEEGTGASASATEGEVWWCVDRLDPALWSMT